MRGNDGVVDENKFASQAVAHGVAQIDFLLVGEDSLPGHSFEHGRLGTSLLGARRSGSQ
jgi:hypothetical protein